MTTIEQSNKYIRKRKNTTSSRNSIIGIEQHCPGELVTMIGMFYNCAIQQSSHSAY